MKEFDVLLPRQFLVTDDTPELRSDLPKSDPPTIPAATSPERILPERILPERILPERILIDIPMPGEVEVLEAVEFIPIEAE